MQVVVHAGVVWAYKVRNDWFQRIKAFPEAVKKVSRDDYVPDVDHPTVTKYVKEHS